MRRISALAIGLLSLLGLAVFHGFNSSKKGQNVIVNPSVPSDSGGGLAKSNEAPNKGAGDGSAASGKRDYTKLRGAELRDAINESMAEVAAKTTPELRREVIDSMMKGREPGYRALFASWELDPATSQQVLEIVFARELQKREALHDHDREGLAGGRKFVNAVEAETKWAEAQLVLLLGQDRLLQLSRLEGRMESEALTSARRTSGVR